MFPKESQWPYDRYDRHFADLCPEIPSPKEVSNAMVCIILWNVVHEIHGLAHCFYGLWILDLGPQVGL